MSSTYSRRVASAYSAVASEYDRTYSTPADLADSDLVFARAKRLYRGGLFVDLGCGPGTALRWEVADRESYLGIDPAVGALAVAEERWPGFRFQRGDHRDLPQGCGFVLGGFGPLLHVPDLFDFASRIRHALDPGGSFLVTSQPTGRPARILGSDISTYVYRARELREAFAWARQMRLYGHRRWTPALGPRRLQRWALSAEYRLPRNPDLCDWIVIEGRR